VDDLSESVADALDNSNATHDEKLQNHEIRIIKLERKAA